jgi:hypothetical protein
MTESFEKRRVREEQRGRSERGTEHTLRVLGALYKARAYTRYGSPCTQRTKGRLLDPRPGPLDVTNPSLPPYCDTPFPNDARIVSPSYFSSHSEPVSLDTHLLRPPPGPLPFPGMPSYPTCNHLVLLHSLYKYGQVWVLHAFAVLPRIFGGTIVNRVAETTRVPRRLDLHARLTPVHHIPFDMHRPSWGHRCVCLDSRVATWLGCVVSAPTADTDLVLKEVAMCFCPYHQLVHLARHSRVSFSILTPLGFYTCTVVHAMLVSWWATFCFQS